MKVTTRACGFPTEELSGSKQAHLVNVTTHHLLMVTTRTSGFITEKKLEKVETQLQLVKIITVASGESHKKSIQ